MSTWPDTDGAAVERFIRRTTLKTKRARRFYRNELLSFQRFTIERCPRDSLTIDSLAAWVKARTCQTGLSVVVHHASKIDRFLESLVRNGLLDANPFSTIRTQYGQRRRAPIVRALASPHPLRALEALRPLPRWGSHLGPVMSEHVQLMQAMGFRYGSQASRFAAFDRFLQSRPDLDGQTIRVLLDEWRQSRPTLAHAWSCEQLGTALSRAMRRLDPAVELLPSNLQLDRQLRRQYRQPYIYTPGDVYRVLKTAREWHASRWPLLPATLYTMFVLAYCAGLRVGEIIRLNVGDVLFPEAALEIRNTKFFKSRRIPLSDDAFAAVREYLRARRRAGAPEQPATPLFWHERRGGRYSLTRAEKMLVVVLRRTGLKPAHGRMGPRIHDMRHALVVNRMLAWYRDGVDPGPRLPYLVTYLGHKSLHSTLTYLTITQELLQHASDRYRTYSARITQCLPGGGS